MLRLLSTGPGCSSSCAQSACVHTSCVAALLSVRLSFSIYLCLTYRRGAHNAACAAVVFGWFPTLLLLGCVLYGLPIVFPLLVVALLWVGFSVASISGMEARAAPGSDPVLHPGIFSGQDRAVPEWRCHPKSVCIFLRRLSARSPKRICFYRSAQQYKQ